MTGRKPRQEAEVAGESLNFDFLPRGFIQRNKNLAQSMSTPSLERVQTQVTRHVSSTLEEWRGNSKTFVDSVQSLASQGFPSLSIEAGPGPMSTKSKSSFGARNVAPLKNGQSGGGDGVSRPQRRNRRNSADSLNDARRQRQSPPSGSPKTPDSNSSSLILSPQSVVPTMRRVMSDTSIENFLKDAKERVVTATTEWSNPAEHRPGVEAEFAGESAVDSIAALEPVGGVAAENGDDGAQSLGAGTGVDDCPTSRTTSTCSRCRSSRASLTERWRWRRGTSSWRRWGSRGLCFRARSGWRRSSRRFDEVASTSGGERKGKARSRRTHCGASA